MFVDLNDLILNYIQGVKNNVYNVPGLIEEVKKHVFYLTKPWHMHHFTARWSYG